MMMIHHLLKNMKSRRGDENKKVMNQARKKDQRRKVKSNLSRKQVQKLKNKKSAIKLKIYSQFDKN